MKNAAPAKKKRCDWSGTDPLYVAYHDEEWGVPLHDDRALFEFLVLEGAQAGLSWSTILRKRDGYRRTFDRFDPRKVARYDKHKVAALLADASIVRNRAKIESAIKNAKAFLDLQEEFGTFDAYQWRFVDGRPIQNRGLPAGATFAYRIAPVGVSGTEGPAATSIATTRGALDVQRTATGYLYGGPATQRFTAGATGLLTGIALRTTGAAVQLTITDASQVVHGPVVLTPALPPQDSLHPFDTVPIYVDVGALDIRVATGDALSFTATVLPTQPVPDLAAGDDPGGGFTLGTLFVPDRALWYQTFVH